jgi:hypothetical protein
MTYILRYFLDQNGRLTQLGPDQLVDDLPALDYGRELELGGTVYRVGGLPRLKQVAHPDQPGQSAMLVDQLLVSPLDWALQSQSDTIRVVRSTRHETDTP